MIKLKSLINDARIISPIESILEGNITLYHGTTYKIALQSKKEGIGPIDSKTLIVNILMLNFDESELEANRIYEKYIYSYRRKEDPNVLFLTPNKHQAEKYALYTYKWQGEIVYDVLRHYFIEKHINKQQIENFKSLCSPAVITINVPLSMVFTHPHWNTPAKNRILNIIRQSKKLDTDLSFDMEVFVYDKIPKKYIQRIDKVYINDI